MRLSYLAVSTVLGFLIAGCASTPTGQQHPAPGSQAATDTDALPSKPPPFSAETRFAAGQVDEAQHNPSAAAAQYEAALQLNPKHLGSLYRLGIINAEVKQYPKAIGYWKQYVAATGGDAAAYADLGFCYELAGQADNAAGAYQDGISRDAKSKPCRVNYGLMLARRGRIADAIDQWQAVLAPAEVHYNLGGVYAAQGEKARARAEFNKALELDPNFNDARQRVSSLDAN